MTREKTLIIYLVIINLIAFVIYGIDKKRAIKGEWRVKESTLMLLAAVGGSLGSFAAMQTFRHKTQKPLFTLGVPLILIAQVAFWFFFGSNGEI